MHTTCCLPVTVSFVAPAPAIDHGRPATALLRRIGVATSSTLRRGWRALSGGGRMTPHASVPATGAGALEGLPLAVLRDIGAPLELQHEAAWRESRRAVEGAQLRRGTVGGVPW